MILPFFAPPAILAVHCPTSGTQYATAEYTLDLRADYRDPFDPGDVALDLRAISPSGKRLSVPGFLYRPYRRTTGRATLPIAIASTEALAAGKAAPNRATDDAEIMVPNGPPGWRVRFAPKEAGTYRLEFVLRTRAGIARRTARLVVKKGKEGFVHVSPRDGRYFALSDGTPYWPLGENLGWAGPRGTHDYDDWLPKLAAAGANWGRVWLSPHWTTFALETQKLGQIDLANAWRLDYVLDLARRKSIRLALCVDSYNVLRDRVSWPEWERSPHRLVVKRPADYWTDPEAARLYRNKLRYLVARYGASIATMGWEFWNEVDGVADYAQAPVRDWHARMATYLHSIDPYGHPVTTSFGGSGEGAGDRSIFALKGLDYVQSHRYDDPDLALGVFRAQDRLGLLGKPHFVGEVGADASGDRRDDDPKGFQIHDPIWASLASGAAGAAMPWWWDSYVGPRDLYGLFGAAARFTKGIAFDREGFRPQTPTLAYVTPETMTVRDAVPTTDGVGWGSAPYNAPQTIRIDEKGMTAPRLARVQQGIGNHRDLHNPVTFETDLPCPTTLVVEVGDVSGYGGAALRIVRDDETVVEKAFPDLDGDRDTTTLKRFVQEIRVEIPAGHHRTTVENPGQDWFVATFRLVGAVQSARPPLIARASIGKRTAIVWVRNEDLTWRNVAAKRQVRPVPPTLLTLDGLAPGRWRMERWDTWTGKVIDIRAVDVSRNGKAQLALPVIENDLALRLRKL